MNVIAIIPARGGSKGIPRKNIKMFNGKPLIAHIIKSALKVKQIDKVIVSTEDEEICSIAKKYGAEVPFRRPENLAQDETPTLPVLQHAVNYLESIEKYIPDIIVLVYATAPLLTPKTIEEGISLIIKHNYDSVVGVVEDHWHYWIEENDKYERLYPKIITNRQFVKPLLRETGGLYLCRRELLIGESKIVGGNVGLLKCHDDESIDIDSSLDFEIAEFLIKRRMVT